VAHGPYDPPERFNEAVDASQSSGDPFVDNQNFHAYVAGEIDPSEAAWDDVRSLYAAGVVHADYLVARLLERTPDDTWVILTADHGEHLGEHGRAGHQFSLYDELIRVPLIVSHPSLDAGRRDDLVSHVDLLPTLLNLLGRDDAAVDLPGKDLLSTPDPDRTVFSEYGPPAIHMNALGNNTEAINQATFDQLFRGIQASINSEYKLLRYSDNMEELYHRDNEEKNILADHPKEADKLRAALDSNLDKLPEIDESKFDNYVRDNITNQLKSLGYL
jgi:arylsulfatase A-like enzyme